MKVLVLASSPALSTIKFVPFADLIDGKVSPCGIDLYFCHFW